MKKLQQFNVFSFNFSRLKNNNFNINITLDQARLNDEIIPLADNEVLRAIRRITNHPYSQDILDFLLQEKKNITRSEGSYENKQKLIEVNALLNQQLFIPEYVSITTEKKTDYYKIGKSGFYINNVKYVRLLCGAGHARTNRTMFISSNIYNQINTILKNGANKVKLVYAKYNAYYSLTSSATYEVSKPRVCVVPDKVIKMTKRVDFVTEDAYQDIVTECDKELEFNLWDGMGLISPNFANQWCEDIELDYLPSAFLIRCAFIKGMVCVFDFQKFAREVANKYLVKDLYGFEHDVRDVDIILTQSQFKLWNCYDNWKHYEACLRKSGIQWGVSKVTPKEDKDFIRTNYQFLQVLNLKDKDIEELCKPTADWIKSVSGGDAEQMKLYLLGKLAKENNKEKIYENTQDDFLKALMLEGNLIKDNYIVNRIVSSLNKRIKESYIGKLLIHGNFQTMINDPYALCEHMFGLEIKGLLKEFEHYSSYWNNYNVKEVAGMRSPLTWQSEVNLLHLQNTDQTKEWYKHITSGIIFNIWGYDHMIHAGSDLDGDLVCTTDNPVFIKCRYGGIPVTYEPKKAEKKEIVEEDLYKTDALSYNTPIGVITNVGTTLYEIQSQYEVGSPEFEEIKTRLKLCCKEQSATIDSAKGIKCKPFPKHWTRWTNLEKCADEECLRKANLNNSILVEKRPYFMRYLYPAYNKAYNTFLADFNRYCRTTYNCSSTELLQRSTDDLDHSEEIKYYNQKNPLLTTKGVMNKICHHMESELSELSKSYKKEHDQEVYDILIDKNKEMSERDIGLMLEAYKIYKDFKGNRFLSDSEFSTYQQFYKRLRNVCLETINTDISYLANLAVEICYGGGKSRDFVWDCFGKGVVKNLLKKNNVAKIPCHNKNGDIKYLEDRYMVEELMIDNI